MPRYFFHLYECGNLIADDEGRLLPDEASIQRAALKEARHVMAAEVQAGKLCLSCRIDVIDEHGRPVLTLPFKEAIEVTGL